MSTIPVQSGVALIILYISISSCTAQSETLIFSSSFNGPSRWRIDAPSSYPPLWLDATDTFCSQLGGSPCLLLRTASLIFRNISSVGYKNLRIVVDHIESGIDYREGCWLDFRGIAESSWSWIQISNSSAGLMFDWQYTLPSRYDNQQWLSIGFDNDANGATDYCVFDNLRVYGEPMNCTHAPCPSSSCMSSWSYNGTQVDGCYKFDWDVFYWCSLDAVHDDQSELAGRWEDCCCYEATTEMPTTSPPTPFGYIEPTGIPTTYTSTSPIVSPPTPLTLRSTTDLPTVADSSLCCNCLTASDRGEFKGCSVDPVCENVVCVSFNDPVCCSQEWDNQCVRRAAIIAASSTCDDISPSTTADITAGDLSPSSLLYNNPNLVIFGTIAVVLFVCVCCTFVIVCLCFCMKRKSPKNAKEDEESKSIMMTSPKQISPPKDTDIAYNMQRMQQYPGAENAVFPPIPSSPPHVNVTTPEDEIQREGFLERYKSSSTQVPSPTMNSLWGSLQFATIDGDDDGVTKGHATTKGRKITQKESDVNTEGFIE